MPAPTFTPTLAVDFGTSNSAVAVLDGGQVRRLALEAGHETLPTAVFFPTGEAMRIGRAAGDALIAGEDGRYMRALKSVLGTALFHEKRPVGGVRQTLGDIGAAFLAEIKARAEAATGQRFVRVLSGRPVHFHGTDAARDARAAADLLGCYLAAGFDAVEFLFEPEAAALAAHGLDAPGEIGLIVDIGGGTSDFSVLRRTGSGIEVLASHGVRLGGTDFDHALSMQHAMPLLGLGQQLRRSFGPGLLPVPRALYVDLSTWAKIGFLCGRETRRIIDDLVRHAVDPAPFELLATVVENELGHLLAFAVEDAKIAANAGGPAAIDMTVVAPDLTVPLARADVNQSLAGAQSELQTAIRFTLDMAETAPQAVANVTLVGGSSLMGFVTDAVRETCPNATTRAGAAFTAIVDGLALAAA